MREGGPREAITRLHQTDATPAARPRTDRELLDRFTSTRDGDAFAVLVRRHGPMVLGVCRRILRDREDAQDAFQVTFLVLARKAAALADSELLANWHYGVAYRTAAHMRGRSARRPDRERQVADMPAPPAENREETREVLDVLDEELNHLPEMYRTLLVLCYLEGKTHREAAEETACPVGSVGSRVARAREMLHRRLSRRGVVFPAGLFAVLLSEQTAPAGVPDELVRSTTSSAVDSAAVSPDHAALTDEVLGGLTENPGRRRRLLLVLAALLALLFAGTLFASVPATRVWAAPAPDTAVATPDPDAAPTSGCRSRR